MNKLFFTLGFLLPLLFYFNDMIADLIQGLGDNLWASFSNIGVAVYPIYLAVFILPTFLLIALLCSKLKPGLRTKDIFLWLFYGFISVSTCFIVFALIAISQFEFTQ